METKMTRDKFIDVWFGDRPSTSLVRESLDELIAYEIAKANKPKRTFQKPFEVKLAFISPVYRYEIDDSEGNVLAATSDKEAAFLICDALNQYESK